MLVTINHTSNEHIFCCLVLSDRKVQNQRDSISNNIRKMLTRNWKQEMFYILLETLLKQLIHYSQYASINLLLICQSVNWWTIPVLICINVLRWVYYVGYSEREQENMQPFQHHIINVFTFCISLLNNAI